MKAYEFFEEVKELTPAQLLHFVGYLFGIIGMEVEGFIDSSSRPHHEGARFIQEEIPGAIAAARSAAPSSDQIPMAGGLAASTACPAFHLIPTIALEKIAERFQLGFEKKGEKSWNAISKNQSVLLDRPFVLDRLSHIIHHNLKLRDKLMSSDVQGMLDDDDASAMAWSAIFMICVVQEFIKKGSFNGPAADSVSK